jgi:ribosomal protein S18 acetylase RimI-like enzyme
VTDDVEIRTAAAADAPEIAHVHLTASKQMVEGIVSAEWQKKMDLSFRRRKEYWNRVISQGFDNAIAVKVADAAEIGIVGFTSVLARENGLAELDSLYVLESYRETKIAHRLMTEAMRELALAGMRELFCFVLAENKRARRFYKATGARTTDVCKDVKFGDETAKEVKLVWSLN